MPKLANGSRMGGTDLLMLTTVLFWGLNRVLKRRYRAVEFLATAFGAILALALLVTGFVFLAAVSVLAWGTATRNLGYLGADQWAVPLASQIQYFIQPLLDTVFGPQGAPASTDYAPFLQNILLGILLLGGLILVFIGGFLLWKLPKRSFYEIIKPGPATTFSEVMKRGREPLAPTVTFKVVDRMTNQASPDVKVVLKHKEGSKVYTRYTDFNGEVIFQKIDGLYSQYYAYVEGDEERKRYWVIRTAIGAESMT